MRIAICDDEKKDLDELTILLHEYGIKETELFSFTNSSDLLLSTQRKAYDIVILDIEMPSPNGYETALKLLDNTPKPLIIFLTNSMDYTLRGYGVAFRYLTKPIAKNKLHPALDAVIREVKANRFMFSADGVSRVLYMDQIYYLEIFNHYVVLHTIDNEFTFRATLKDVLAQLPLGYFGLPHQSYIVNFAHVKTATQKEIRLTNGICIPISRRKQKDFEKQFYLFLGR